MFLPDNLVDQAVAAILKGASPEKKKKKKKRLATKNLSCPKWEETIRTGSRTRSRRFGN